jgi:hypothetical protein
VREGSLSWGVDDLDQSYLPAYINHVARPAAGGYPVVLAQPERNSDKLGVDGQMGRDNRRTLLIHCLFLAAVLRARSPENR